MTTASLNRSAATEESPHPTKMMEDWTIGELLKRQRPAVPFRRRFMMAPILEHVTLRQLLIDELSLEHFLEHCRKYPHCGDLCIKQMREVIQRAALAIAQ